MCAVNDADVDLMLRVKEGDREAFRVLFQKYSPRVLQFVRRVVGSQSVAEELTQDVFLQVYRVRRRYRAKARFSTWIFTIAANRCRNEMRRRKHQSTPRMQSPEQDGRSQDSEPVDGTAATAEEGAAAAELKDRLEEAIACLPVKQKAALLLSREDGLAYRDIGKALKCSEGAVKALIFRATQSIKRDLGDLSPTAGE